MKKNKIEIQTNQEKETVQNTANDLSKSHRVIFTVLMLTIPFLFFLSLEAGLRLFNYGGNLDLFVLDSASQANEYILNKNFTTRYFFKKGVKTPTPISQRFSAVKDSTTYRIFCLGASTTQGFPYQPNAAFPAQLQNILTTFHPDRKIEVINCGITAITSHSVLDMASEIVDDYEPDLLIAYTGHNEFYGVLGQASNLTLFSNYSLIRTFLTLQQSRLFLLLRDASVYLFGDHIRDISIAEDATLMERFANTAGIPLDSELFKRTEQHFRQNLAALCDLAKDNQTDLIICNLVDNQSDFIPFSSLNYFEKQNSNDATFVEFQEAKSFQDNAEYQQAISLYNKILSSNASAATVHYYLGQCYQALQKNDLAVEHYQLAKDYDLIRFRAPSSFNKIIKDVAETKNVLFADINQAFSKASPDGFIGNELMLEHVHPNFNGYYLLAKSVAEKIKQNGFIKQEWDDSKELAEKDYLAMCQLTELDHEVANYIIFSLTSHWPFPQSVEERSYFRVGNERSELLAREIVIEQENNIVQAHLDLGEIYLAENELQKGLAEYKAALAIEPHCDIYNRIGPVYTKQAELAFRSAGDYQKAALYFDEGLKYFTKGINHCPEHFQLNFNLGLLYALRADQFDNSLMYFKKALELNPSHKKTIQMIVRIHFNQKEFDSALRILRQGVEFYPKDVEFLSDIGYLYAMQKDYQEAENWLNKALELQPYHAKSQQILKQLGTTISGKNG